MKPKRVKLSLSLVEWILINSVINSVRNCMEYDNDLDCYSDGGRFLLTLDSGEMNVLNNFKFNLV